MGKRIPTVNYSLTKEISTYTALVEFKFMTTSVVAWAKNKQVIKININQTKNNVVVLSKGPFIASQLNSTQLDVELSCVGGSL